jgi:hypothetical protein
MPDWVEAIIGAVCGLALIGVVFWFAFGRVPERRGDGGLANSDATSIASDAMRDDGHHLP